MIPLREIIISVVHAFFNFSGYSELIADVREFQRDAYAATSKIAKKSQLNNYFEFIDSFNGLLSPLPCSTEQACAYIVYMSKHLKYSSMRQYLSSLNNYLRSMSSTPLDYSSYELKTCLKGALRRLGGYSKIATPLLPKDLLLIFSNMNNSKGHTAFRAATLLSFRALLRKSQFTESASCLRRSDVSFYEWGMLINVRRSKTIQFGERLLQIPVAKVFNIELCAVYWLRRHFLECPAEPDSYIITIPGKLGLPYSIFQDTLKYFCSVADLDPDKYSSHSLRRGGATFLSISGSTIDEIKVRGDWASSCVFKYLQTPIGVRISDDMKVANLLSGF